MTGMGISSGLCWASGWRMRDKGSSVFSSVSGVDGMSERLSRANLGEELHWSIVVKSVCEEGGVNRLSQVQYGVVFHRS